MRANSAQATDIVVLCIAADSGLQPQTVEVRACDRAERIGSPPRRGRPRATHTSRVEQYKYVYIYIYIYMCVCVSSRSSRRRRLGGLIAGAGRPVARRRDLCRRSSRPRLVSRLGVRRLTARPTARPTSQFSPRCYFCCCGSFVLVLVRFGSCSSRLVSRFSTSCARAAARSRSSSR